MLRSRSFSLGFFAGLVLFATANIYTSYPGYESGSNNNGVVAVTEEFDALKEFGWPFRLHRSGTILHLDEFLWKGLVADLVIAVCVSVCIGLACFLLVTRRRETTR
jgi:hypothetical protein